MQSNKKLYNLCENNKIETDEVEIDFKKYITNPNGLYHMRSNTLGL